LKKKKKDIDVYTTDKFGNTSLHYCALANHVEVIQVLLDKDSKHPINIDIQNLKYVFISFFLFVFIFFCFYLISFYFYSSKKRNTTSYCM